MHHLLLSRLTCARGDHSVFSALSAELHGSGCTLLKGANGTGKSSLLRILAGLLAPEAGTIHLDNRAMQTRDLALKTIYCTTAHTLKPDLTVMANLERFTALYGCPDTVIDEAIDDLGLDTYACTPARHLSNGMQRRAVLARLAIARHAAPAVRPIWLLDEPEDSLDSDGLARLNALLNAHHNDGGLSIIASHRVVIETQLNAALNLDTKRIENNIVES